MTDDIQTVFVDQEVTPQILAIIDGAHKYVMVVTPYLDLWGHVRNAIERALKKGVKVTFFLRGDSENLRGESVQWLTSKGVKIYIIEKLHAKIFLNEQKIIVTSMNLLSSSSQNSLEVAIIITNPREQQILRNYVLQTLQGMARPIGDLIQSQTPQYTASNMGYSMSTATGYCIRCGIPIGLDAKHPLCDMCYDDWAEWENAEYREKICHFCGKPSEVSYARPLCAPCYQQEFRR